MQHNDYEMILVSNLITKRASLINFYLGYLYKLKEVDILLILSLYFVDIVIVTFTSNYKIEAFSKLFKLIHFEIFTHINRDIISHPE